MTSNIVRSITTELITLGKNAIFLTCIFQALDKETSNIPANTKLTIQEIKSWFHLGMKIILTVHGETHKMKSQKLYFYHQYMECLTFYGSDGAMIIFSGISKYKEFIH